MRKLLTLLNLCITIAVFAQQEYLPIYSDPMVFVDREGRKVGELPPEWKILNTAKGEHSFGWRGGKAPNSVKESPIPAMHYQNRQIALFDLEGNKLRAYGTQYQGMTPLQGGFFLAFSKKESNIGLDEKRYYFLNEFGQPVFEPRGYSYADGFSEGMAAVKLQNKWIYINDLGHEQDLVPEDLSRISTVYSFHSGLSRIKISKGSCGFRQCYRYVFINKKGEVVLDTDQLFPDRQIESMSNMSQGISTIRFHGDPLANGGYPYAYIDTTGKIIFEHPNLYRSASFSAGYLPVMEAGKDGSTIVSTNAYLINREGEQIDFPKIPEMRLSAVYHFSGPYFRVVYFNNTPRQPGASRIYDVRDGSFLYELDGTPMGIKWDLLSLRSSRTLRCWVINLTNGQIVYDTEPENRIFYKWEEAKEVQEYVRHYVAEEPEKLVYLQNLTNLKSLTFRNMRVGGLPSNLSFSGLETLRIDDLMELQKLPSHIKGLKKLSIRNCVKADNLMEMLEGQPLESLHLINFGLSPEESSKIKAMFPNAEVIIQGRKENATMDLQVVYPNF